MRTAMRAARRAARGSVTGRRDAQRGLPLDDAVIVTDHSLRVRSLNDPASLLLGWDDPREMTHHVASGAWSPLDQELRRQVQLGLVQRGRWEGSRLIRRRDGATVPMAISACVLNGSPGLSKGVVLVLRALPETRRTAPCDREGELFRVGGLPGPFSLHYQAEIDLSGRSVTAVEGLLRWWHPGLGLVSPGPALSHPRWSARLASLEIWSIFAVCRQAQAWAEQGYDIPVAVNLSQTQVADPDVVDRVRRALALTGLDPAFLAVDVPAAAFARAPQQARRVAGSLAETGVTVVLDQLTDTVAESQIRGVETAVVKVPGPGPRLGPVAERVERARRHGAKVVAVAVETDQQLVEVRNAGCDHALGHLFSRPLPVADLTDQVWANPTGFAAHLSRTVDRAVPAACGLEPS